MVAVLGSWYLHNHGATHFICMVGPSRKTSFIEDPVWSSNMFAPGFCGESDLMFMGMGQKYSGQKGEAALDFKKRMDALITHQKVRNPQLLITDMLQTIKGQCAVGSIAEVLNGPNAI